MASRALPLVGLNNFMHWHPDNSSKDQTNSTTVLQTVPCRKTGSTQFIISHTSFLRSILILSFHPLIHIPIALPLQAWTDPGGSRRLRPPEFLYNRHMKTDCQPYAPAAFIPPPQEIFLVLIYVRGWVDTRATVRPEGESQLQMNPPGTEPATLQGLDHCATTYRHTASLQVVHHSTKAARPCPTSPHIIHFNHITQLPTKHSFVQSLYASRPILPNPPCTKTQTTWQTSLHNRTVLIDKNAITPCIKVSDQTSVPQYKKFTPFHRSVTRAAQGQLAHYR